MAQSFEAWWASLGLITKVLMCISIFESAAFQFGFISPFYFVLDMDAAIFQLQIWRFFTTCFFLGKFGMSWMFNIAMFVMYIGHHEEYYLGKRAEFAWMLSIIIFLLNLMGWILDLKVLASGFIMALVWIYCRRNEDRQMTIYAFAFNAKIFPLALVAFHLIMGGYIVGYIMGIVAGHFYFFFHDMHPLTNGGKNYLQCPRFMYNLIGENQRIGPHGVHVTAAVRPGQNAEQGGHRWEGRGQRLGTG